MTTFLLPRVYVQLQPEHIHVTTIDTPPTPIINHSLSHYLTTSKQIIDKYVDIWDVIKKVTNPYEYIHTPVYNSSIACVKPLSRSYFKMIEIAHVFKLLPDDLTAMKCFYLAEGPGGFIEAVISMRKRDDDLHWGMTLIDDTKVGVPGWNKSADFIEANSGRFFIERGADNTGNLLSTDNFKSICDKYGASMDLITADGGFDFSSDYNAQETTAARLIIAEICYAIAMQRKGGCFVLKMFDLFTKASIDMLYILSHCYDEVYVYKPNTSRYANSEKYIVCKNFKNGADEPLISACLEVLKVISATSANVDSVFANQINGVYLNALIELNAIIGQQQLENINSTITLIEQGKRKDKIELLKKQHIAKCIEWCKKHGVPYNV